MITIENLYRIAKQRFDEAKILHANGKPEGAVYLCGYAIELILKQRIVKVLDWDGYPETNRDFKDRGLLTFKTHDLNTLLFLSGLEKRMKADTVAFARWQAASTWNSEIRYRPIGSMTGTEAQAIIEATRLTVNFILTQP